MTNRRIEKRLKELKKAIEDENISYGEFAELQSLRKYIKDDEVLEEWAGIPEKTIKEYIDYLGYAVEEGYVDEDVAKEIIDNEEWEKVEEMMFKAEELANEKGD